MSVIRDQLDIDLMRSRRAFPVAQALLEGPVLRQEAEGAVIGWHGSATHPETGSVALVREDGEFSELVGNIVRIDRRLSGATRSVYAYVVSTAPIEDDLSLSRRAFLGLGVLANETLDCSIQVLA